MKPTLLTLLRKVDTPTVCNAIEVAQGKRGFDAFTRGTMLCSAPDEPAMVRQRMAGELDRTGWALIDGGGERGTYRRGSYSVILDIREARPGTEIRVEY